MREFAALTAVVQSERPLTNLSLQPNVTGTIANVAVAGTVPSAHLKDKLTQMLKLRAAVLKIDANAVEVTGRYAIREGDTFSSIASSLCGRASLYKVLQSQNLDTNPRRMRPGSLIVVACQ
jgi:hypothetical protein